jgi:hypothetical protein
MGYTLGQAAKAVGMSKTSILRSIKTGRISAKRDEFGRWASEACDCIGFTPPSPDRRLRFRKGGGLPHPAHESRLVLSNVLPI